LAAWTKCLKMNIGWIEMNIGWIKGR
jgi:hypothetical protein